MIRLTTIVVALLMGVPGGGFADEITAIGPVESGRRSRS